VLTRTRITKLLFVLAVYACLPACSQPAFFRPREHATGESPQGIPAAEYQLDNTGGLLLWSQGAWYEEGDAGDQTVIHFGFEVENESQQGLEILAEEFRLQARLEDGRSITALQLIELDGPLELEPETSSELHLWFASPELDTPGDIEALNLRWLLRRRGEGNTEYRGSTKFRRDYDSHLRYGYYRPYGYYSAYGYHPLWGYGRYCY
jgi:hypothetical protein